MNKLSLFISCLACLYGCAFSSSIHARDNTQYYAHLSVMPVDRASFSMLSGGGEADAELSGPKLTITGTFSGLSSAASSAFLHKAAPGLRGPSVLTLNIIKQKKGGFDLSVELAREQLEDFRQGFYYLQINSLANPNGEIRGWLLPGGHIHE